MKRLAILKWGILALMFNGISLSFAQEGEVIYQVRNFQAKYEEGNERLIKDLQRSLLSCDSEADREGAVFSLNITINADGTVDKSKVSLLRGSSCEDYNRQVVEAIATLGKFVPAKLDGQFVKSNYNLQFYLAEK